MSLGKNDISNLWVASSYWNHCDYGESPVVGGKARGVVSFFDYENNRLISAATLKAAYNQDFIYVYPSGEGIVSENHAEESSDNGLVRFWHLEEYPVLQEELKLGNILALPRFEALTSDYKYVVSYSKPDYALYETGTGRCVGRFKWVPKTYIRDDEKCAEDRSANLFAYRPDVNALYLFNTESRNFRAYSFRSGKCKLKKVFTIKGLRGLSCPRSYFARLDILDDGKHMLFQTGNAIGLFNAKKREAVFQFDRTRNKADDGSDDDFCHAAISPDARLLYCTRKLGDWQVLEVWDMHKSMRLASFNSGSTLSNIILADKQCTVAMGNGEICTLLLENYQ